MTQWLVIKAFLIPQQS